LVVAKLLLPERRTGKIASTISPSIPVLSSNAGCDDSFMVRFNSDLANLTGNIYRFMKL
jgi:hypothetical protein